VRACATIWKRKHKGGWGVGRGRSLSRVWHHSEPVVVHKGVHDDCGNGAFVFRMVGMVGTTGMDGGRETKQSEGNAPRESWRPKIS
jgi:hypothetical protein